MINPDFELNALRNFFRMSGLDMNDIEYTIELARQDIEDTINGIVNDALIEAASIGEQMGAQDFIAQLYAKQEGFNYRISTESGKTDFSEPPFPMLPKLLKNAKVAKDGTLYKNIPMRSKTLGSRPTSIIDMRAMANDDRRAAMENRKAERAEARKSGTLVGTLSTAGFDKAKNFLVQKRQAAHEASAAGPVSFKTATSKQNASTRWVIPEKKRDMTSILSDINNRMENDIQQAIRSIVQRYKELM
jgi:hypothetical protein